MTVAEMMQLVGLEVRTAAGQLDVEVTGGYACDLLSAVIANAEEGNVWVTWHAHPNIVAVALLVKLSAVILISGRQPEEATVRKAEEEGLPILVSERSAFEVVGRLYSMGITGAT